MAASATLHCLTGYALTMRGLGHAKVHEHHAR